MTTDRNPHDTDDVYPELARQAEAWRRNGNTTYAADWIFNAAYRIKRSAVDATTNQLADALSQTPVLEADAILDLLANWPPDFPVPDVRNPNATTPRPTPPEWAAAKTHRQRAKNHQDSLAHP